MAKTVKRCLIPCAMWDMERLESWLEDMALEGWYLRQDGIFAGFASFEKVAPRKVRYRLEITPKKRGIMQDSSDTPDEEALSISESMGWQFVASHWQYYIYRCEDETASELHTDPELLSESINALRKRELSSIITLLFWICIYPLLKTWGETLRMIISLGTPLSALILLYIAWEAIAALTKYLHLRKLRVKLREKGSLDRGLDWKKGHIAKRVLRNFSIVLLIAILTLGLIRWKNDESLYEAVDPDKIPFALPGDIYPDAEVSYVDGVIESQMRIRSDFLSPEIISVKTMCEINDERGQFDTFIIANYCEMRTEGLAKSLYGEMRRQAPRARHYSELEYPELSTDEEFYYIDISPTVILRKGNKVLRVTFSIYSDRIEPELWLKAFADSL